MLLVSILAFTACRRQLTVEPLSAPTLHEFGDVMLPDSGTLFYYRHPEEGAWMKRTVWLPDESVVAFFRRAWLASAQSPDGQEWFEQQLGGRVYGLSYSLARAIKNRVARPLSTEQLRAVLNEHLTIEGFMGFDGSSSPLQLDAQTLRVKNDDDDYDLSYGFVPVSLLRAEPERFAFLAYDRAELPASYAAESGFHAKVQVPELLPAGNKPGRTYVVAVSVSSTGWLETITGGNMGLPEPASGVFPGVRVPDFVAHLRTVVPAHERVPVLELMEPILRVSERAGQTDYVARTREKYAGKTELVTWPHQWITMRASIPDGDVSLHDVFARWSQFFGVVYFQSEDPQVAQKDAHRAFVAQESSWQYELHERAELLVDSGPHHAVMHRLDETWVVFDDLWATAHPELANSLLVWGLGWDPVRSGR